MRVLALTSSYPRYDGDATAPFIESITTHTAALGHEVHLVLPEHHDWSRPAAEGGVHFHPYRYSPLRTWTPWGYSQSLEGGVKLHRSLYALAPLVFLSGVRACSRLAKGQRFDLVHAHWLVPNGLIGSAASARIGLPLVISLHGSDISVSERSRWLGALVRRSFARADAVTAPSEDLLDRARRLGATGTLELIPYGADADALHGDEASGLRVRERLGLERENVMVLGLGRFVHWKGFDVLIDAVAQVTASAPDVRLVFAGDGDLRDELMLRVRARELESCVTFAGMVLRDEVPAFLAAADVVAVPSVHYQGYVDGLPNVALEAMASAKPVVATRVGGLPQVIRDGDNGFLVEERDVAGLATAILTLAHDPPLRRRMGDRGHALVRESLNWNEVGRRFDAVYERVRGG
jgi:phosphatidyl-myo-inositol dimannoside synthase